MKRTIFYNNRTRATNAGITSSAGEFGPGDRGAFNTIPQNTGNPYDSQDYITRWRQYVHLYETSWEARKIIRIPIEDALRKPCIAEGIPEGMIKNIEHRLQELQFTRVLSRSMMLERLLGGCLTFMGIEGQEDDPSQEYHVTQGQKIRFLNAVPISRINRIKWDTDPLSENYMRPKQYLINGQLVDVSRCLVWDGDPLFDPSDFYLTNFRANLAGFGPSKLATLWDDIVKAVGTRQAAYQLIKTNNAIIMAVKDLQDLAGTDPGKKQLQILKDVANHLSLYRAAVIDNDKVSVQQSAASFGSVPELIITFIQILSAASDIPATRFLGQAPGGLNATGESDLENYYNVIDAMQTQRIEPHVRRMYDILGYEMFSDVWEEVRQSLTFKFPSLWNETAEQESSRHSSAIENVNKLLDMGMMGDKKALEELNLKGVMSVELDESDLQILEDTGLAGQEAQEQGEEQPDLKEQVERMKNVAKYSNADSITKIKASRGEPITQFSIHGMSIVIESPQGSLRKGVDMEGTPWESILPADYGYIAGTKGADGDEVDVYIGPTPNSELIFVVDQNEILTGKFDEHKVILGTTNLKEATDLYIAGFSDDRGADRIRAISPVRIDGFLEWAVSDTTCPFEDWHG